MGYWVDMSPTPTGRWTRPTSRASGGRSSRSSTRGLLYEAQRVSPYCPRCETALSDHELAQGYETVVDPSVYVRLPLTSGPLAGRAALLVWTTTPWTLVSNTAVAVHPDVDYVVATDGNESLVVAAPLFEAGARRGLDGHRHGRRPRHGALDATSARSTWLTSRPTRRTSSCWPTTSPPTTAPGWSTSRRRSARRTWRCAWRTGCRSSPRCGRNGHFADDVALVGGQFFKHADTDLVRELERRGVAVPARRLRALLPALLALPHPAHVLRLAGLVHPHDRGQGRAARARTSATNWFPETIKWGRYGDWLRNNVDWSLSRTRYWGTPLPLWRCDGPGTSSASGSLAELGELAGADLLVARPAPAVRRRRRARLPDACGGERCRRVREVIDAWYDSGSMPFAQWGYPHADGSEEEFEQAFPAQFICEGLDQTRGWFYSLMAIGTLVFDRSSYENVVCLGLLLAEDGRKMSKHLGNILEPMPLMDEHGADAVRWFMAASGSPWAARRVGHGAMQEIVRKVLLTYWNTVAFHALYARANGWAPGDGGAGRRGAPGARPVAGLRTQPADPRRDRRRWRCSTPSAPGSCSPTSSTTCRTGTSAARVVGSGTATRPPWPPCTRRWTS